MHEAVLLEQAVEAWFVDADGFYVDGTFGRGGHSRLLLERLGPAGRLLVVDKDPEAIKTAEVLAAEDDRVLVRHGSFADMEAYCQALEVNGAVSGVLLDLGVSSPQLDDAQRGFSFNKDGPLDMRMDSTSGISAEDWINSAPEAEIADVLYEYGEERYSRRMARAVVAARKDARITSTLKLADIIKQAHPAWERHKHPATRAFQGIRIFINNELGDLAQGLEQARDILRSGGRLVVVSFHSLEDRRVKRFIQQEERGGDLPPDLPVMQSQLQPGLRRVGKAVKADRDELGRNVRARSAVMRVAEKVAEKDGA